MCFGGIFGGILGSFKFGDIEPTNTPNQGIKTSGVSAFILTGGAFLLAAPLKLLLEQILKYNTFFPSQQSPSIIAISLTCMIWVSFIDGGGQDWVQHIALRLVLAWNGYAPYRYDKLLDYCTERLLLQRIGGRYRFMHKLLQEHFAKMPLD